MRATADQRRETLDAVHTLNAYLRGERSLDELIAWAERLDASQSEDAWLREVALGLSNPLLCREQATALVHEHLRTRATGL